MNRWIQLMSLVIALTLGLVTSCTSSKQEKAPATANKKCGTNLHLTDDDEDDDDDETEDEESSSSSSKKVTYDDDIKKIMTAKCVVCHGSKTQKTSPLLDTYDLVKKKQSSIASSVADDSMPKTDDEDVEVEALTSKEKTAFADWKKGSYLKSKTSSSSSDDEDEDEESSSNKKVNSSSEDEDDESSSSSSSSGCT